MELDINMMEVSLNYIKKLEKEKEDRSKYNLINTGKEISENFNIKILPNFNNFKYPYLNLEYKFITLISGLDTTNELLKEVYDIWKILSSKETHNEVKIFNTYYYNRINKLSQYIVYDLKRFADEVVATTWILYNSPTKDSITIADIGDYKKDGNENFKVFDKFLPLFDNLNNLCNAYKHSYLNTNCTLIGKEEPCFWAIGSKSRNLSKYTFHLIPINQIINEFNDFYKFSFNKMDYLTQKNKKDY